MFKTIKEAQEHLREALGFPVTLREKEKLENIKFSSSPQEPPQEETK